MSRTTPSGREAPSGGAGSWGRVLVVMPTYNESDNLENVSGHLLKTVPGVDILVVDDASPDGTGDIADRLAAGEPRIHVLHRFSKDGLGRAYLAGFAWADEHGYDAVVEMDADGSHPAETLPAMLDALVTRTPKPGLVIGSRWIRGGSVVNWPRRRLLLSRAANLYTRMMLAISVHDVTAGYRVYPTDVVMKIGPTVDSRGYSFQVEMALRVFDEGLPIVEIPIEFRERTAGASKMSGGVVYEAMIGVTRWGIKRAFRRKPRSAR